MEWIQAMDWTILYWIQNVLRTPFFDWIFPLITRLGDNGYVWIFAGAILLFTKKYRKYGIFLLTALLLGLLIGNMTIKPLVARPRPFFLDTEIPLLIPPPDEFSFPSGHMLSSTIAATVLTLTDKRFGYGAVPLAVLIGFSRMYLFVHFPSDVFAAAVLGVCIGFVTFYAGQKIVALSKKGW